MGVHPAPEARSHLRQHRRHAAHASPRGRKQHCTRAHPFREQPQVFTALLILPRRRTAPAWLLGCEACNAGFVRTEFPPPLPPLPQLSQALSTVVALQGSWFGRMGYGRSGAMGLARAAASECQSLGSSGNLMPSVCTVANDRFHERPRRPNAFYLGRQAQWMVCWLQQQQARPDVCNQPACVHMGGRSRARRMALSYCTSGFVFWNPMCCLK